MVRIIYDKEFFNRTKEIVKILTEFGFGYLVEKIELKHRLPLKYRIKKYDSIEEFDSSMPIRLRLILEELGSTYIKFGQILSTREDLIKKEFIDELSKLQDNTPEFSYEITKKIIETELKKPVDEIFSKIDKKPIASASIGQVHRGTLKTGEEVVVKVQKPDIDEQIANDIKILKYFANLINNKFKKLENYKLCELVEEFERSILKEIDYIQEKQNLKKFSNNFKNDLNIYVPKVFEEFSTKKVLTLEFVKGVKVSNIGKNNSNYDTKRIARIGVDSFFKQILEFGFFHADPHPGNIIILKNNTVCFLDFGMMGHINRDLKNDLIELFVNLIDYNLNGLINKLTDMNLIDEKININLFKNDLIEIMDFYYENELENVELSKILRKLIIVLNKYNISIPRDFLLLSRALILIEGIGRKLDSKINLIEICKPYTKKALKEKFNPKQLQDLVKNNIFEIEHLIKIFPRSLKKSLDKFSEGEIKIDFKHKNLDNISNTLDRAINKLSLAMIISSLIIGFSLIIQKTQDFSFSLFSSVGIFSILGLTASVILGFYLINYILNPKK